MYAVAVSAPYSECAAGAYIGRLRPLERFHFLRRSSTSPTIAIAPKIVPTAIPAFAPVERFVDDGTELGVLDFVAADVVEGPIEVDVVGCAVG